LRAFWLNTGEGEKTMGFAIGLARVMPIALCLGLGSCSLARQAIVRNATGADLLLWPLSERPLMLKAAESTEPIVLYAHDRHEALVQRGNCLYTYPAPEYSTLPNHVRNFKPITLVIRGDMRLALYRRSKEGVEGPEITVAGFPLAPSTFCGSNPNLER
jgi:hypothetical protein